MEIITIIAILVCFICMCVSIYDNRYDKATFWAVIIGLNLLASLIDKVVLNAQ